MTNLDTTTSAPAVNTSAFGSGSSEPASGNGAGANVTRDPFSVVLSEAYKIGKDQGMGDGARFNIFDLVRVGTLEETIKYEKPAAGRKAKGAIDNSHIAQVAKRFLDGVVKTGGNESKATQKSRLNTIAAWCAGPASREQDATWQRAMTMHGEYEARNKAATKENKVAIYAPAELMLRVATMYGKGKNGDNTGRTTPLTDAELETCIKKQKHSKEFLAIVKSFITNLTAEIEERGGDDAEEEYKTALSGVNALQTLLTTEFEANEQERSKLAKVDALVAAGILVRAKNGKGYALASAS